MREENVSHIIGWILLPITILLMLYFIFALLIMPNFMLLLVDIVIAGVLLYLIRSMNFLQRNVLPNKPASRNIRAGIRIGSFFATVFILNIIMSCVSFLSNQDLLKSVNDEVFKMMQARGSNSLPVSPAQIHQLLLTVLWAGLIYALLLLLHLLMSFLFLRRYRYLFEKQN